jgi:superfamily II DNA or RNA helicase
MIELRPYQKEAIKSFKSYVQGEQKRGIVVFPTGCGKTIFGLSLAKQMGGRCLWLAHRDELITQPLKALKALWPSSNPGVVKADRNEWAREFVFASVQTAWRDNRLEKLKNFDLVVVDECHHAAAKTYKTILEGVGCFKKDGPPLLGLTATPERTDNFKLDDVFQSIVYQFQLRQAVESGYLVDVEMVQRSINIDLDNISSRGGDWAEGELDNALLEAGIVKEVCNAVDEHAKDKKAIIFTVSVKQAQLISQELLKRGYPSSWVAGILQTEKRRERLRKLGTGEITHLANCMVLTEGFDEPSVDCIIMARPTQSKSLYIQCVGRGLRIAPGKDRCTIIDMVGLSKKHTLIQAPVIFGLEANLQEREKRETIDDMPSAKHAHKLLLSQLKGVAPIERSALRWVPTRGGGYALNCGDGGTVILQVAKEHDWYVDVVHRTGSKGRERLTMDPIDLELAQGVAEDYVRRASAVYLSNKSSKWRSAPATDKQIAALKKWKVRFDPDTITKGEASDLLTHASASSPRNDPATSKQIYVLRKMGIEFDPDSITKGEAGRLLSQARR